MIFYPCCAYLQFFRKVCRFLQSYDLNLGITTLLWHITYHIAQYSPVYTTVVSNYALWYVERYRCRQWHVPHLPPSTQNLRSSAPVFCPSGDRKALMRMCVKCSIVLSGMQASLSFSLRQFSFCLSVSVFIPCSGSLYLPPFSLSTVFLSTDSNSVCLGQVWEGRFAAFTGLKQSRAAQCCDYLPTSLCMRWAESQQPRWLSSSVVASHLQRSWSSIRPFPCSIFK